MTEICTSSRSKTGFPCTRRHKNGRKWVLEKKTISLPEFQGPGEISLEIDMGFGGA
jgi:hypothetical protein